jgi:cell division septal protein FtsQ
LDFGLKILREAEKNKGFKDYRIISLYLAGQDSAIIFLTLPSIANAGIVEVKLGKENIISRLRILEGLLYQFKKDWNSIKYIDLRFKEPAIKFHDMAKNKNRVR